MKKIAIIGGGFTGCISALLCTKLGYEVEIFERKNELGGVVSDLEYCNDFYFNGPQYYETNSWWLKDLKKSINLKNFFLDFPLRYGSYNDLFNKNEISKNFAQIKTSQKFKNLNRENFVRYNNRINSYQKNISKPLTDWSNKFCKKTKKLHHYCADILNTGKVFFSNDQTKVKKLKSKDRLANILLGLPSKEYKKNYFSIPAKGNKEFFKKIEKALKNKRVKIFFILNNKIKKKNNKIKIYNGLKNINSDKYIWCTNPVPLLKILFGKSLDNPIVDVKVLTAEIELKKNFKENIYIQTFLRKYNLFRIFLYKIDKKTKMCLEIIYSKNQDMNREIKKALSILKNFGIIVKKYSNTFDRRELRHILFTIRDLNMIQKYEKTHIANTILPTAAYWPV